MKKLLRGPWLILFAGLLVGAALGLIVFFGMPSASLAVPAAGQPSPSVSGPAPAPFAGSPAPDFTLDALDGGRVSLSGLRGQPVLINFWFTTCGPCRIEMPAIQSRYERYRDQGLRVLAVNFDEPKSDVADFAEEFGLTFDVLLDPGAKVQDLYRVRGYPTSFFVDRDGVIQVLHIGLMSDDQIDENLAKIGIGG